MKFKFKNHLFNSALIGGMLLAPELYAATKESYASGINNSGQVVVITGGLNFHAALWQSGSTKAI
jgi:hypothetical protein